MLINYIKIAYRNLFRHRFYTFINVLGLTVGLTCAFLLFLYIRDELSFDQHYANHEEIYRVNAMIDMASQDLDLATSPGALAPVLKKDYPEVSLCTRVISSGKAVIKLGNRKFYDNNLFLADSTFFQILSHRFIFGDAIDALKAPQSLVVTETFAKKLFGSAQKAFGQRVEIDGYEKSYTITAVLEDLPKNSSLQFTGLLSMNSLPPESLGLERWFAINFYTFVRLQPGTDYKAFEDKLAVISDKYAAQELPELEITIDFEVQPLASMHFHSNLQEELGEPGNMSYIYILSAIAIFILLIASINYMNLATARSTGRAREVGIRKVLGSHSRQLMGQFLVESSIVALSAFILSLGLVELLLPWFNVLANKALVIQHGQDWGALGAFLLITFLVGTLSGVYPAFFLSRFNPVVVLKGKFLRASAQGVWLRKGLVVLQFSISITMIIGTWIVYQQLSYVQNKDLGFDPEQVLVIDLVSEAQTKASVFKEEFLKNPEITKVAGASGVPGAEDISTDGIMVEQEGGMQEKATPMLYVDYDYLELMDIKIKQGRSFSLNTDSSQSVIINETLAKQYGWKEPLNKKILNLNEIEVDYIEGAVPHRVIGVMEDFHLNSLHKPIEPITVFSFNGDHFPRRLFVKLQTNDLENTLAYIEKVYKKIDQVNPYQGYFLDQQFAKQYQADQTRGQIFFAFSILTVFIACLGLLGLAAFTADQRTKEIGIRKILGASIPSLLVLVSREFFLLVLLANPIAFLAAYFVMNSWLQNFAYRTELWENWFIFLLAGVVALFISILTVSYQVYRAATINPAHVLRNE